MYRARSSARGGVKSMPMNPFLPVAKKAARAAAEVIRRGRIAGPIARRKADGSFVTDTDLAAEKVAIETIRKTFPRHGVLSEESGRDGEESACWVIDPLDGTTNFVSGIDNVAVSVAFCRGGRAVAGAICDVGNGDIYAAAEGEGAWRDERRLRVRDRDHLRDATLLSTAQLSPREWSGAFFLQMSTQCAGVRRLGATALDFALIAEGAAGALFGGGAQFWDVAAGALILREAGGLLADLDDNTVFEFGQQTGYFVGGAPKVFARVLRAAKDARAAAAAES